MWSNRSNLLLHFLPFLLSAPPSLPFLPSTSYLDPFPSIPSFVPSPFLALLHQPPIPSSCLPFSLPSLLLLHPPPFPYSFLPFPLPCSPQFLLVPFIPCSSFPRSSPLPPFPSSFLPYFPPPMLSLLLRSALQSLTEQSNTKYAFCLVCTNVPLVNV